MLICGNIACGLGAARGPLAALWFIALLAVSVPFVTSGATAQSTDDRPATDDCIAAFMQLRQWTDAFTLPPFQSPEAGHDIADSTGVYIALRGGGNRVIGSAAQHGDDDRALRRAAGSAFVSVLSDSSVRAVMRDREVNLGRELSIELEVAGPLQPLIGRTAWQIGAAIEPGLDGLAMKRGRDLVMLFPAQMRRSGSTSNLEGNLARLAGELGLKAMPVSELRNRHRVSVYRFRTVHLAQSRPDAPPRATHRGLHVVGAAEVTPQSVRAFTDALAGHILTHLWPGDEPVGMLGDYDPLRDRYHPLIATPRDQALSAFALLRYAKAPGVSDSRASRAADAARQLLRELNTVTEMEAEPTRNPAAAAMIICAAAELPDAARDESIGNLRDRALQPLQQLQQLVADDGPGLNEALNDLSPSQRGMIALALVLHERDQADAFDPAALRGLLDAIWKVTPPEQHVALMPWLGWAELKHAARTSQPIAHSDDIRRIRAALWNQQVRRGASERHMTGDTGRDWIDLIGGFALTGDESLWGGRPTAQSIRPAALLATMWRHESLTPDAVRATAGRSHRLFMRFLMQLAVRDRETWSMLQPQRALGGLRTSAWEHGQPVAAQALGLLTAVETLTAMQQLAGPDTPADWPGQDS